MANPSMAARLPEYQNSHPNSQRQSPRITEATGNPVQSPPTISERLKICLEHRYPGLTYIAHLRVEELAPGHDIKQRALMLAAPTTASRSVYLFKARANEKGDFSIGKEWKLRMLSEIRSYTYFNPTDPEEQEKKKWAGKTGFRITIGNEGKHYFWRARAQHERDHFLTAMIDVYKANQSGRIPLLVGFPYTDQAAPRPTESSPTPPRPDSRQTGPYRTGATGSRVPTPIQSSPRLASASNTSLDRPARPIAHIKTNQPSPDRNPVSDVRNRSRGLPSSPRDVIPPQFHRPPPGATIVRDGVAENREATHRDPHRAETPPNHQHLARDAPSSLGDLDRPDSLRAGVRMGPGPIGSRQSRAPTPSSVASTTLTTGTKPDGFNESQPSEPRSLSQMSGRRSETEIIRPQSQKSQAEPPPPGDPVRDWNPSSMDQSLTLNPLSAVESVQSLSSVPESASMAASNSEKAPSISAPISNIPAPTPAPGSAGSTGNRLRAAASKYPKFQPRSGGAGPRLNLKPEPTPSPSIDRLSSSDVDNTGPASLPVSPGLSRDGFHITGGLEPPEVRIQAASPVENSLENSQVAVDSNPPPDGQLRPGVEISDTKQQRSQYQLRCLSNLGIDPTTMSNHGLDFEEVLDGFGWGNTPKAHIAADALLTDIGRALGRLEAGSLAASFQQSEEKVEAVGKLFDRAIAECDEMESLLTLYGAELSTVRADVAYIEAQSRDGLQVRAANQMMLRNELDQMLSAPDFPSDERRNWLLPGSRHR